MLRTRAFALLAALALMGSLSGCGLFGGGSQKTLTASFDRAIGAYVHSDVRILGVKVGQITKITPKGTRVVVEMTYDANVKVPADAQAFLVAPSIVSDRYVQLTPVYRGGPTLADRAVLGTDRTGVPVELDQVYSSLDDLNAALGPDGANSKGALADLLKISANNLKGNGAKLNTTLSGLSQAVQTLSDQRSDLFATITNLQQFTTVIAQNDSTVRAFNANLAAVAAQLSGERVDLATAVRQLSVALGEVTTFVKQNKTDLTANVRDLASVTKVLVTQKRALKEFIDTAPTALSNLQLAYNARSGTLDTRSNMPGGTAAVLCELLAAAGQPASTCKTLTGLLPVPLPGGLAAPTGRDLTLGGILAARP